MSSECTNETVQPGMSKAPWERSDEEIRSSKRARKRRKALAKVQRVREERAKKQKKTTRPRRLAADAGGRPAAGHDGPGPAPGLAGTAGPRDADEEEEEEEGARPAVARRRSGGGGGREGGSGAAEASGAHGGGSEEEEEDVAARGDARGEEGSGAEGVRDADACTTVESAGGSGRKLRNAEDGKTGGRSGKKKR